MKTTLSIVYGGFAAMIGVSALVFPKVGSWALFAVAACVLFWLLSIGLAVARVADGARIAGLCLHGASTLAVAALLGIFAATEGRTWLFAAAVIAIINLVLTGILMAVLRAGVEQ